MHADPAHWPVHPEWSALVRAFFVSPTGAQLIAFLQTSLAAGATVTAYDPVAMKEAQHCFPNEPRITFAENQTAALEGAEGTLVELIDLALSLPTDA